MSSFIIDCINGYAGLEDIDDYVDAWHDGSSALDLPRYLGMNNVEYAAWVARPEVLPFIVRAHREDRPMQAVIRRFTEQTLPMAARSESREQALALEEWLVKHGLWTQ